MIPFSVYEFLFQIAEKIRGHRIVSDAQTGERFCTCHGMSETELKDGRL